MSTVELSVSSVSVKKSGHVSFACVSDTKSSVCPVLVKKSVESFVCPVPTNKSEGELSTCRVPINGFDLEQSVCTNVAVESVTELSASSSVNAPDFELSANSTPDNAVDVGLSVSSVSVNEPDYEPSSQETVDELFVFPALTLLDCVMFRASGSHSLGGGGSVMNSVHGLPFARHQRSLFHHIDSHTTQTVPHYLALQFP